MTCSSLTNSSLFEQILEELPDGITVQDRDFNIIHQNAAMKRAFGDRIGYKCHAVYEGRNQVCEGCGLLKAFETGKPIMVHRTGILQDDKLGHWENSCFPLYDDEGNIIAGVEVCRDVTDRVALTHEVRDRSIELGKLNDQLVDKKSALERQTEELEAAYKELQRTHGHLLQQEKMASIGQLAAGMAHEINTPIQYVGDNIAFLRNTFDELIESMQECKATLGSAGKDSIELSNLLAEVALLFERLDIDFLKEEIPLALEQTADGAKHIANIVLALKNFAYCDGADLGPVEVDDIIHSTVEISRNAWNRVADLRLELTRPVLVVRGQKSGLGQVLLNLILNAVDAIAALQLPENERGQICIRTQKNDRWGEILIEDTGCGIEPALMKRIFEPFFTTKEVGQGSGQGLAIAYGIITETHNGELQVESELGKGSTFIVRLPLED